MRYIYVHGLGQTANCWEQVIEKTNTAKYSDNIDLIELSQNQEATYENLYKNFCSVCNDISDKINLCGLSLGGVLALNYALDYPEKVNSLVLIATQYKMPKMLLKFQNLIFKFMPNSAFKETGFGKSDFIKLCKTMSELNFSNSLSKIDCPVLVVCGEKDNANMKASTELNRLLKKSEIKIISNSGHEVNKDAPEELAAELNAFYNKLT